MMRSAFVSCLALGVLALSTPPQASADQWNKKTILTVNETIEVPGATLTPGKYVVLLHDSPSNRNIVRIMNERQDKVMTTVIAIPNQRLQPTGDTVLTFYEMPTGQAPALRAWFYPGDTFGQEFVYPQKRAEAISAATRHAVPSMDDQYAEGLSGETPTWRDETELYAYQEGQRTEAEKAWERNEGLDRDRQATDTSRYGRFEEYQEQQQQQQAQADAQQQQQQAEMDRQRQQQQQAEMDRQRQQQQQAELDRQRQQQQAQQQERQTYAQEYGDTTARRTSLPRTASPVPAVALFGLLSLGAGILVRRRVR
jgi:hypothetical protein